LGVVQQGQAGQNNSGNRVEISTYTYLEISGRSELESLILQQAELFKEQQKEAAKNLSGEVW
jgi:hypothetical protein